MSFLNLKQYLIAGSIFFGAMMTLNLFKNHQISELENKNATLELRLSKALSEGITANAMLAKQNEAIRALRVDIGKKSDMKIQKIFIKDNSCQGELSAYKELLAALWGKK